MTDVLDWLYPEAIVLWGSSSERYRVVCVVMTGVGPAVWIQSTITGFFVSIQPDEVSEDLKPEQP